MYLYLDLAEHKIEGFVLYIKGYFSNWHCEWDIFIG